MTTHSNRRILLVDDTPSIHDDFRKILMPARDESPDLDLMEAALFGQEARTGGSQPFELDSAYGGQEGLAKVEYALAHEQPYALAFVDMRMPQGWDGAETIEHLWQVDPNLQVVVCTAYTDYSWEDLLERLHGHDRLLILKKPFDNIEVQQLANTLTNKWEMTQRANLQMHTLEELVEQRTQALKQASQALQHEIDERKQLESQLVQSEKLASLGQLAAGVAHEINNPIGFIGSNLGTLDGYFNQLQEMLDAYRSAEEGIASQELLAHLRALREKVELDFLKEDIPLLIKESKEGIGRVGQIVKDLKNFSRVDSNQEWQWSNLQQGIESTLNIVANELKYKADVIKDYAELPEIECLPSQINQVIMNLVVNAAQAIGPERGTISLRGGASGERVWLEVADTGSGMAPETVQKIFDPFFTTKPIGQGTGLGLSLSYGIVRKHAGQISVRSALGTGTTFRVELPIRQSKTGT
ncbi:ATP-binding protein [Pseudomonas gingeri]|uniref:histidine kinase n=1 Tax=Pseudomonas gingeri TaxID=117681 RepID=A0A7Y7YDC1_9PSED|nr:ATP-binding protein [Pseudomonas gingeri]NWB27676.1 hybrid sensor histidine kinase/response regulator [Pseudomonas gingeri]NWC34288.1 hybrid sensor histidine kinase/response regulator [Pseudomonas gingeri]NWD07207.1 hybrid sensor histidine kinase/response regulator [Pseudomonas gingeri]NWD52285.1 hybrid sensor histidine kinase/response regulator [Pseudomonas gingeri]NWE32562.1 hybrid sensor histidine kinase/response regulator [Pseudomonas gingeri]